MKYFIPLLWMILGCGWQDPQAGGTTVETTNGIAGVVHYENKPVANARVLLMDQNHVPTGDPLLDPEIQVAITDTKGHYQFDRLPLKTWRLLVRDTANIYAAITEIQDSISYDTIQLLTPGTLQISTQHLQLQRGDLIALQGSDLFMIIDSSMLTSAFVQLTQIPSGTYAGLIWMPRQDSAVVPQILLTSPDSTLQLDTAQVLIMDSTQIAISSLSMSLDSLFLDSASSAIHYPTLFGKPPALILSAQIRPLPGLSGGEVINIGDHVGFRVDTWENRLNIYAYSSYEGASNWHTLSSYIPITTPDTPWVQVDFVVAPHAGRLELWINHSLDFQASADSLYALSWDKAGTETYIGRHALSLGNPFIGWIDSVKIRAYPNSSLPLTP